MCPTTGSCRPASTRHSPPQLKLTFTRDGEKDHPGHPGQSLFNVVVTNTEKIRIQKDDPARGVQGWTQVERQERERQEREIANLRLQAIASLPHLAVFSDEAHHTYGQSLDTELKKVRKTVDYLHGADQCRLRGEHHRHAVLPAAAPEGRGGLVRAVARASATAS